MSERGRFRQVVLGNSEGVQQVGSSQVIAWKVGLWEGRLMGIVYIRWGSVVGYSSLFQIVGVGYQNRHQGKISCVNRGIGKLGYC